MARSTAVPFPNESDDAVPKDARVTAEFQHDCVEFFADFVQVLGVPRSVGQIYGLLYSSPEPLSFTDIAEKLDISKGSASQGLKALRELGAIREAEIGVSPNSQLPSPVSASGGSRRELYAPELGLRKLVSGVLREKVEPIVSGGSARLDQLRAHAAATRDPAGRTFSEQRVKQLDTWRRQMRLLLPLLKTILGPVRPPSR